MMEYSTSSVTTIRNLIDKHFSLQWCRDNLIVPISLEPSLPPKSTLLTIAVGNITFLGTVGPIIKERLKNTGFECRYVEYSAEQIQEILDQAVEERFISGEAIDINEFSEDEVLAALRDSSEEEDEFQFDLEFDEVDEINIEDEVVDITDEMTMSKTQKAAGMVLIHAYKNNVSDIHVEPKGSNYKIRLRKDGVMQKFMSMPNTAGRQLVACLKNMAGMDIAERRASQDGKIYRKYSSNQLEFRCATSPGKHGEGMVLRILNSDPSVFNLDTLIVVDHVRSLFRESIAETNGIVIVSGPTGSGKSTTLASALRELDNGEKKIVTAEDPIEYDMGGDIIQHQVNRAKKQTFAAFLRVFLRQDPDVILIGETRDPETAVSSMDAAETGHLVFTTLHANTAISSLTRLLDMGVPDYKINSSIRAILAQKLLRKICPHCSVIRPITPEDSKLTKIPLNTQIRYASNLSSEEKEKRKREKSLCLTCNGSGYNGRIGTYELLVFNRNLKNAIREKKSDNEIETVALDNGMVNGMSYGIELVKMQLTSTSELIRHCRTSS